MSTALQHQAFALDARYNAHRVPGSPNFKTLYIRRRSQLLRETSRDTEQWKQYLKFRSILLQHRYGVDSSSTATLSRTPSMANDGSNTKAVRTSGLVVPNNQAVASKAFAGGNSIAENYAFVGLHHIFDQHTKAVTMIKFANNDRSKLCCCSLDGDLSICDVVDQAPKVVTMLKGHTKAVTGFDWSANNDLIVSVSLDGTSRVWNVFDYKCLRVINEPSFVEILCCLFQPINNNLFVFGSDKGELRVVNVSTGRYLKSICRIGGRVLSLAVDSSGKLFWAGNDRGEIVSIFCEVNGGLCKTTKISLMPACCITSISYKAWINREARDPLLLANAANNSLYLFSITDFEGTLRLKRKFLSRHQKYSIRSTFCPIISFRQGSCVVTGSEDGSVYFLDVEKSESKAVVNTLQGHAVPVLDVSFNYDESFLATCDLQGLVIIWKKGH